MLVNKNLSPDQNASAGNVSLSSGVARFSAGTLISRILGLVREQVFAIFFGAGAYTDAFFAAFRIPNLLRDLFAEGVFSAAFIPTFSKEKSDKGIVQALQLANLAFNSLAVVTSVVSLMGVIFTPLIVWVMAPGFSETAGQTELTIIMARIMFPLLILVSLASVATGVLNTFGRFGVPALAPTAFNVSMILCGIFLRKFFDPPIISMALGVLLGGVGQLAFQVPALLRIGFKFKPELNFKDERIRKVFRLMVPASVGTAAIQINLFVATLLASLLPQGSLSYLNYGYRLMQLPLGLFAVGVASVSLPKLSMQFSSGDMVGLKEEYLSSLRFTLFLMIPAIFFILSAAYPIVGAIYQHGKFHFEDTTATVNVLRIYALGLFAFGTVRVTSQVFFAMHDTHSPTKVGILAVIVNIILNLILMRRFGFLGLAAATTISGIINMSALVHVLRIKLRGIRIVKLADFLMKTLSVNILLAGITLYVCNVMHLNSSTASGFTRGTMLLALLGGYIISYLGMCRLLKVDEIQTVLQVFRRRIK